MDALDALLFLARNLLPLLLAGLLALALAAIVAPLGPLRWWASSGTRRPTTLAPPPADEQRRPFLVYLSGIGDVSGEYASPYENAFLDALRSRVPGLTVVDDVFAFSPHNQGLTSEPRFGWFWRFVHARRLAKRGPLATLGQLVLLRNILQFAVSADRRYGPIYNYGTAEMILQSLIRHGYRVDGGAPLALLGYSGGAQIAVGAARYLKVTLGVPVQVISLAGFLTADPALDTLDRLTHLYGTGDWKVRIADLIFPGRWPQLRRSAWNRALAEGRVVRICAGPMRHDGRRSYLDDTATLPDGQSYMAHTADLVAELILTPPAALPPT